MAAGPISLHDLRQVFEIVHECRELWADPQAWEDHLLRRAAEFTHCRVAFRMGIVDEGGRPGDNVLAAADVGWDTLSERQTLLAGIAEKPLSYSPLWNAFIRAMPNATGLTALQSTLIGERAWHASEMYDQHIRPTHVGEALLSAVRLEHTGTWDHWCISNDRADPAPSPREAALVAFLHEQIAAMIGHDLTTWRDRSLEGISARRRQVLQLLLDGHSEKEIATKLDRSTPTVREHIAYLYRHFGVSSRSQLAAYFVRRRPRQDASQCTPRFSPENWLAKTSVFTPGAASPVSGGTW